LGDADDPCTLRDAIEMIAHELLIRLSDSAEGADQRFDWPAESWQLVGQAGGFGWSIPKQHFSKLS
jgi:hypothetical protein